MSWSNMIVPDSWNDDDSEAKWYREKYQALHAGSSEESSTLKQLENELSNSISRVESAAKQVKRLEAKMRKVNDGGSDNNDEVNEKLEEQRRLLNFYEIATSMVVRLESKVDAANVVDEFICTVKNALARRAVRFSITDSGASTENTSGDDFNVKFIPKANAELLPEYLQQSITFERDFCPVLVNDVLSNLYAEDDAK